MTKTIDRVENHEEPEDNFMKYLWISHEEKWNSQYPHFHSLRYPQNYPQDKLNNFDQLSTLFNTIHEYNNVKQQLLYSLGN